MSKLRSLLTEVRPRFRLFLILQAAQVAKVPGLLHYRTRLLLLWSWLNLEEELRRTGFRRCLCSIYTERADLRAQNAQTPKMPGTCLLCTLRGTN